MSDLGRSEPAFGPNNEKRSAASCSSNGRSCQPGAKRDSMANHFLIPQGRPSPKCVGSTGSGSALIPRDG